MHASRMASLMLAASLPMLAFAQEAPTEPAPAAETPATVPTIPVPAEAPPAPSTPANGEATQLDDVVVTAQRQVETVQKAAVSIDAVEGKDLSRLGIVDVEQLQKTLPSLITRGTSGVGMFVRGVGTIAAFSFTDPAVSFNYDGVYIPHATEIMGLFYDLERVELLKGPQGTLYGRNATGGALNVLPARPELAFTNLKGNLSYGSYNGYNLEAAYNQAVGNDSAARLSVLASKHDGILDDGGGDRDLKAARGQWFTHVSDALEVRFAFDAAQIAGFGEGRTYLASSDYDPTTGTSTTVYPGFGRFQGQMSPAEQNFRSTIFNRLAGRNLAPLDSVPHQQGTYYGVNTTLDWTTSAGQVTVLPAWRKSHFDTVTSNSSPGRLVEDGTQYSLEARLADKELFGLLDYTTGAYLFHETVDSDGGADIQQSFVHQVFNSETLATALFGRVTAHVTDALRLVGGLRVSKEDKDFTGLSDALALFCINSSAGANQCPTTPLFKFVRLPEEQTDFNVPAASPNNGPQVQPQPTYGTIVIRQTVVTPGSHQSLIKPTYRAAVEYDLAEENLLFASYETGFRSGGFSIATGYETYKPESIVAMTIGSKNRFFKVLEANFEAFHYDYKDQQIGRISLDRAGNLGYLTDNIASSTISGFEFDGRMLITPLTRANVAVQYLKSHYTDFTYEFSLPNPVPGDPALAPPPPRTGCPFTPNLDAQGNPSSYTVNCSGFPAFGAPSLTISPGISQTVPVGGYTLVLNLDSQYRSRYVVAADYLPFQYEDPTWHSSFTATVAPWSGESHWAVTAFVRNIEDGKSKQFALAINGIDGVGYEEPRTFGVRINAQF